MVSRVVIWLLIFVKSVIGGRGFFPHIFKSIEQVRDPFVEGVLSFNDLLVDLNEFYGNMENDGRDSEIEEQDWFKNNKMNDDDDLFGFKYIDDDPMKHDIAVKVSDPEVQVIFTPKPEMKERKYLTVWKYKPVMAGTTGTTGTSSLPGLKNKKMKQEPAVTSKKTDNSLSDEIFRNWEEPGDVEEMELQRINIKSDNENSPTTAKSDIENNKMFSNIRRKRKKKTSLSKIKILNKVKTTNLDKESSTARKSLYKWYKKMKESGRFNF